MFNSIFFPFTKFCSTILLGKKIVVLPIFSSLLLALFSSAAYSVADVQIQGAPATTNATAFSVTAVFTEAVTEFVSTDVTVSNAAVTAFVEIDAANYSVEITPNGGGDISIDIPAGVALDVVLAGNNAAPQVNVAYDATPPSALIQGAPAIVNSTAAFNVSIVFSEDVTGFIAANVSLGNATVTNFTPAGADNYTVEITPDGGGNISIDIAADVAQDAALNGNTAATQVNIAYDATSPSVLIQGAPAIVNSTAAFNVSIVFSEDVTGFIAANVSLGNATVTNFTPAGADNYTVEITPDGGGNISIDIAADVAQDAALNGNTAATQVNIAYDATSPSVLIQGAPAIVNSTAAFNVSIVFSEDVTGFIAANVSLGNATVTNFTPAGADNYTVEITPDGGGNISIDVAADVAQDAVLNGNTAATQVNIAYDATPPSTDIQGAPASVNSTVAFNVSIVFSEDVTGFIATDVSLGNAAVTNFTPAGADNYTVEITPDGGGNISIDIAADVAQDVALNGNTAATQVNVIYDSLPGVDIQGEPATFNTTDPFNVTVEFSEDVTGFMATDVSLGNATVSNFTPVDGNTYTVEITPSTPADISIDIGADVAQDATLNGNTAAVQAIVVFNNLAPIANAGPDQVVNEGNLVTLDGSGSTDFPPDIIATYAWTQTDGPAVVLSDSSLDMPQFDAPSVIGVTLLQFDLVVTDSAGAASAADSVTVTVGNALVVDAGVDQQVTEGDVIYLNGLNSLSINNSIVAYRWTQVEGPVVALNNRGRATASFTAPLVNVTTLLVFELIATDSSGATDSATTLVNVRDQLLVSTAPPLDVQLLNKSVNSGAIYQFDTVVDPFGLNATEWTQVNGVDVTLIDADTPVPSFTAPTVQSDNPADFEVRSTDIDGLIVRADVSVNILQPLSTNLVPDADAGVGTVATEGETVQLDATGSTDGDGSITNHLWHQTGGPGVVLSSILQARPTFVAPPIAAADSGITLSFEVLVSDDGEFVDRDSVTVTVLDNGISDFADNRTAIVNALGNPVSISIDNGSLVSLHAIHPASIVDVFNRPSNLPYGLFDFSVRVEPRSSVQVSFTLPTPASNDMTWWKYTNSGGWMEFGSIVSFNSARDVVTVTLTDNGVGDDNPVLGIIRDPGGLGPISGRLSSNTTARADDSSGGSGGNTGPYLLGFLLLCAFARLYRSSQCRGPRE